MKFIFSCSFFLLLTGVSIAQTATRDSIKLSFNKNYELVDDSCAQIIMYGHINMQTKKYFGKFIDISTEDSIVVAEGRYTNSGLKNGPFISKYLNGNLQAKGSFKMNNFDGNWDIYYEDGKPEISFKSDGNSIQIINAWDTDGKKIVENGSGEYRTTNGDYYWEGKIANGKPEGTWVLSSINPREKLPPTSEYFKKNVFKQGNNASGKYSDSSHIILIGPNMLPFINAEKFISSTGCDLHHPSKYVVKVQYRSGWDAFKRDIYDIEKPIVKKYNLSSINKSFTVYGEIDEKGQVSNLKCDATFNIHMSDDIIDRLYLLSSFQPATVNGKPVREKFTITFEFDNGYHRIHYKFLKIEP